MANSLTGSDSFEGNIDQINKIIKSVVSKWNLQAIAYMDKQDVESIIRAHLYVKWNLYDKSRPLANWVSVSCSNQLKNLFRNKYYKFASPCLDCPKNLGSDQCELFGEISSRQCGIYNDWVKTKKDNHDVNLPVTAENHQNEINSMPADELNFDERIEDLKIKLQNVLIPVDYHFFINLTLQHRPEKDVLIELNFPNKTAGLLALKLYKLHIIQTVKNILNEEELF